MESEMQMQEPNIADVISLIRKGLLIALSVAILTAVTAFFLSRQLTPRYAATATIVAAQTIPDTSRFGVSLTTATPLDIKTYLAATLSFPVLTKALNQLGTETVTMQTLEDFKEGISVRTEDSRTSSLLRITVRGVDPTVISQKANAIANAMVAWDKDRATENLQTIINTLRSQITALDQEINRLAVRQINEDPATPDPELEGRLNLRAQQAQQLTYAETLLTSTSGLLKILEPALPPIRPVSPNPIRDTILAFVLGIFLSYGVLLLRNSLSTRFKDSEEIAKLSHLPILAEFPKLPGNSRRLPQEAVSYLRTNLLFALSNTPHKTILITSAMSSEGKSSVAMSLADSFARNGYSTLLIDADLRKPIIAKEYKIDKTLYGTTALEYALQSDEFIHPIIVNIDKKYNYHLYPSFNHHSGATELLSRNLHEKLSQWRNAYDIVIIDSAPVLPVADTLTIAPLCSGTLLIAGFEGGDKKSLRKATELLNRLGINILGIAATQYSQESHRNKNYGYGYGYGQPDSKLDVEQMSKEQESPIHKTLSRARSDK